MHDLKPITALGGTEPRVDIFNHVTITENDGLALASVVARLEKETACETHLISIIGGAPSIGKSQNSNLISGFGMGPHQWMLSAPSDSHELLADQVKSQFDDTASVTEQSGAWVCFDITGDAIAQVCERLCNVAILKMVSGDTQRTVIHQLSCFVTLVEQDAHLRVLGPRASALTLHHALVTAAHSTQ